jgi:NAD(P)-dependent dehydrogenase (short-subunit alcohol dehydrogenase family)
VSLDVTDVQSIKAAVAHAETEAGTIDILVNNSGVSTTQKLVDVTPADFEFVFDTNTRGAFFVAQEVAKRMMMRANGAAPASRRTGSSTSHRWPGCACSRRSAVRDEQGRRRADDAAMALEGGATGST